MTKTTTTTTTKTTKTSTKNTGATNPSATEAAAAKEVKPKQGDENPTGCKVHSGTGKGVKRGAAKEMCNLKKPSLDVSRRTPDDLKAEYDTSEKKLHWGVPETQPEFAIEIRHRANPACV